MSDSNGNGNGSRPSLAMLGAPHWFVESERLQEERHTKLCQRVSALEQAVVVDASTRGARAGRKWGAILGALVATFASTALSQCPQPASAPPGIVK